MTVTVALAADDAGFELKQLIAEQLRADERVGEVLDYGVHDASDDRAYPRLGLTAAEAVAAGDAERGVLICGTGIGMCISANKVGGVRATVAHDSYSVERSIKSNDCQVLTMGSRVVGPELAKRLVDEWLGYSFDPASASAEKVAHITHYEHQH
ncbi:MULTISPECIES: ribose-5-phosphate isomerase [Actinopolyspora]|uniref:D-erythrulose 4-phosphate isomerase n=1 Tax=Actinopolyspora saharensis TaxID=995062 RepID=A0A1H1FIK5_9ACTN|nr:MULTISPECIES: ribose-5-phosphate isomerase [Actinopolyspora]NHD18845.1 ribose-5-phosphate isomerase [Actinopolyspora sp. BKK2]NHE77268.1 ribose-5-phosphate isomerase [Actinopolyspora sp. BKK1]SDR00852.1 ribose-5-phosphate isomerase [Actinopolyspora saharensis]